MRYFIQNTKYIILALARKRAGQSLIEVVVGLGIGALLIGAGAFAISAMLRSNLSTEKYRAASGFSQELIDTVRSFAGAGWQNLYGLAKGSSTTYYLNASGTTYFVVSGGEGMLDNDVKDGLVAEWKFDESTVSTSTTTYDATGSNNSGTLVNGTSRASSTCKIANCMSFNATSSNYISVPNSSILNFTTNGTFSISLWVNPDTLTSGWRRGIIVQETYLTSGFRFGFSNGGAPVFWTEQSGGNLSLTSSQSLSLNQWSHLTAVYNNQQGNIYLNGIQVASSTGTYVAGSNNIYLGAAVVESFSGLLDDVRYYNRALSADEIKRLYNSGIFKRFFAVENVCRTNDASSTIAGTAPCSGTSEDASTEQITVHAQWTAGAGTGEAKMTSFLTRARNAVFQQTDWSGGSGASGAYTAAPTTYASGTNVSSTPGSIQILNLTQQ